MLLFSMVEWLCVVLLILWVFFFSKDYFRPITSLNSKLKPDKLMQEQQETHLESFATEMQQAQLPQIVLATLSYGHTG